jgi:hypothetical protein
VRRFVLTLACLAGLGTGSLLAATSVLASGTNTSAGDQQYVDPLTSTTSTSHPSGSSTPSSSSSGSSSSGSGSSLSQAPSTLATGSSSSGTTSSTAAHSGTLPFTGMNVWACIAIGVGLLGTGLVLRRSVHAT